MCTPGTETCVTHDCAVAWTETTDIGAGGEDFDNTFVAGNGGGLVGSEGACEWGFGGVDAFDLGFVSGGELQGGRGGWGGPG